MNIWEKNQLRDWKEIYLILKIKKVVPISETTSIHLLVHWQISTLLLHHQPETIAMNIDDLDFWIIF